MKKTLKLICFGIAVNLLMTNCVQKRHMKTVTFRVNMDGIENSSEVGIKGEFTTNPWNETLPLHDDDNDGIYEGTFSEETAQNGFEFKFVLNGVYELEGKNNRSIQLEYKPETLVYEAAFNNPKGKLTKVE